MARTRLKQLEQIRNSITYNDNLNMGSSAELQADSNIGSSMTVVSVTAPDTIVVTGNLISAGVNSSDRVTLSGGTNNGIVAVVASSSYNGATGETTIIVVSPSSTLTTDSTPSTTLQATVDPYKNLLTDLNHIRTQLRKLNQKDNWYDDPLADPTVNYQLITGTNYSAGSSIVLQNSMTFDAGEPYTLKVYLNGQLMLPSTVSGGIVTSQHDYTERDSDSPVGLGEIGDRISFAFDIVAKDLIQLRWAKKP